VTYFHRSKTTRGNFVKNKNFPQVVPKALLDEYLIATLKDLELH